MPHALAAAPVVTKESGTNGCNGLKTTPGSENTTMTLVQPANLSPGSDVTFRIEYPVDAEDVNTEFKITDCMFVNGVAAVKYTVTFVPNITAYALTFTLEIPLTAPTGSEICNYAKTTESPSHSQASNRKAGTCFGIGGGTIIEKRDTDGALLAGATFDIECTPIVQTPAVVITGLDENGVSDTGIISIEGPEGTPCVVTELAAPGGYLVGDSPAQAITIGRGESEDVTVFVNAKAPCEVDCEPPAGDASIEKHDGDGALLPGATFDVDCDPAAEQPEIVITGLDEAGVATDGSIHISGPEGTECVVTETAAPDGYVIGESPAQTVTLSGETTADTVFVNEKAPCEVDCEPPAGDATIEKHDGDGALLPGATFDVDCDPAAEQPELVITGLDEAGVAGDGSIFISGPEGTECVVTETAAPEGYLIGDSPSQTVTLGSGLREDTVFVNEKAPCQVDCEPDCTVDCEPAEETPDPVTTPKPTKVLGVKNVKPVLPVTGAATTNMLAAGLLLLVAGGTLTASAKVASVRSSRRSTS